MAKIRLGLNKIKYLYWLFVLLVQDRKSFIQDLSEISGLFPSKSIQSYSELQASEIWLLKLSRDLDSTTQIPNFSGSIGSDLLLEAWTITDPSTPRI